MTALARYDAACAALSEAVTANEIMQVRVTAQTIEAVARAAGNFEFEIKGAKLRTLAEARLGEMLDEGERSGLIASHGGRRRRSYQDSSGNLEKPATLKEIGVAGKLAAHARRLSGIGKQAVETMLARFEAESMERGRPAFDVINQTLANRNADTRRALAREISDASAPLSPTGRKFPVLYADPAWKRKAGIGNRAYENHYGTMDWSELLAMPVKDRLLPDAWGFVWIPRAHLLALVEVETDTSLGRAKVKMPLAWALAKAWGFDSYSTCFIWTKTDDEVPDDHGLGLIAWDQDELLLLFKRGRGLPKPKTALKYGSNHRERAGKHSAKPTFYRDMINDMTRDSDGQPAYVLELFAREDEEHVLPPNFFTWGNQSKNTAEIECDEAFATDTGELLDAQVIPQPSNEPSAVLKQTVEEEEDLSIPAFLRRPQQEKPHA